MHRSPHPSLVRIYSNTEAESLYFDETYSTPQEELGESFYALTAVQLRHSDLDVVRALLANAAGGSYWHTTEALQTADGQHRTIKMLDYCKQWGDPAFITCKTEIKVGANLEDVRRDCMRALLSHAIPQIPTLGGLVFEARRENKDNDRDRRFIKLLRKEGVVPSSSQSAWVSPSDEKALWLPDLIGMAYRRTRTHQDFSADYFSDYLEQFTTVLEI